MDSPGTPSDWYDVTVINGISVPIEVDPTAGTYSAGGNSSPYECGSPGAPSPSTGLVGCGWQIPAPAATSTPPWPVSTTMRYVDPTTVGNPAVKCTVDSDCGATPGQICGLTTSATASKKHGTLRRVCGFPAGYWSPVQLCGEGLSGLGPISGAFQCATPMCNEAPPDPDFPTSKMPSAGCSTGHINFPAIACSTQGPNSQCAKGPGAPGMVCDLNSNPSAANYCVPMMTTGSSTTGVAGSPTTYNEYCPTGATYDPVSNYCLETAGPTCANDTDCTAGFTCLSGVPGHASNVCAITAECNSNLDCPTADTPFVSCSNGNNVSSNLVTPPVATSKGECVPDLYSIYGATAYTPDSFYNAAIINAQQATGYEAWVINGTLLPYPSAQPTPSLAPNPNWLTHALPFESLLKTACPSAYSYQYDDPYSLFTCNSASGANQMGYTITFCPAGSPSQATFPTATPTP